MDPLHRIHEPYPNPPATAIHAPAIARCVRAGLALSLAWLAFGMSGPPRAAALTVGGRTVAAHPRLLWTAAELQARRRNPADVRAAVARGDSLLAKARTTNDSLYAVDYPDPQQPPRRVSNLKWPYWTALTRELDLDIEALAYAWQLTHRRAYFDRCRRMALALSNWWYWTDLGYGREPCMDTAYLTKAVAVAYDCLYDSLSVGDRATLSGAIAQKGIAFMRTNALDPKSYLFRPSGSPNAFALTNAAMGLGALALLQEQPAESVAVLLADTRARAFLESEGGADGGLIEGMTYGTVAIDPLVSFGVAMRNALGGDLLDHPYFRRALDFPAFFLAPGGSTVVNFGDNGGPEGCRPALIETARTRATGFRDPVAAWYLGRIGAHDARTRAVRAAPPSDSLSTSRTFSSINWAALRTGWSADDVLVAFKCGTAQHHNHLDQNSFVVAAGDDWIANDPGYQRFAVNYPNEKNRELIADQHEYTFGTVGHNTLLVAGRRQNRAAGSIDRSAMSPRLDFVRGNATPCYTPLLTRAHRYLGLVKTPGETPRGWYVLWDDVERASPSDSLVRRSLTPPQARATSGEDLAARDHGAARDSIAPIEFLLHADPRGVFRVDGKPLPDDTTVGGTEVTIGHGPRRLVLHFLSPVIVTARTYPHCANYGHYLSITRPGAADPGFVALLWVEPNESAVRPVRATVEGDLAAGAFSVRWSAGGAQYGVRFDRAAGTLSLEDSR